MRGLYRGLGLVVCFDMIFTLVTLMDSLSMYTFRYYVPKPSYHWSLLKGFQSRSVKDLALNLG
jgi:hypothetical protein